MAFSINYLGQMLIKEKEQKMINWILLSESVENLPLRTGSKTI